MSNTVSRKALMANLFILALAVLYGVFVLEGLVQLAPIFARYGESFVGTALGGYVLMLTVIFVIAFFALES